MKNTIRTLASALAVLALVSGPTGCGANKGTEEPAKYSPQPTAPPVGGDGGKPVNRKGGIEKSPRAGAGGKAE